MTTQPSLSAYRAVLRSIHIAFKGDARMLRAAYTKARQEFELGRNLTPGSNEVAQAVEHAQGVATVLRQNVVQGERADSADQNHFRLRIHEDTERGDNETISQEIGKRGGQSGIKCG